MNRNSQIDHRRLLADTEIFSQLSRAELDELVRHTQIKHYAPGEVLFSQGDPGEQMFTIISGAVRIAVLSHDGKEIVVRTFGPGEVFGEIALFDGKKRSASVKATEPSTFLILERRDFVPFLERHPKVAIKLLATLTGRLRQTSQLLEDTLFIKLPSRLAKTLLELAKEYGQQTSHGLRINAKFSQQELGTLINTSGESIREQLGRWQNEGVVTINRGFITIKDPGALTALV